jgi:hypothetical protein
MPGISVTKADVNQAVGTCARAVFSAVQLIKQHKTWLDTQTDANLIALGFVQAEVDQIRSAMTDLDQLRTVFEGTGTRTPAYDYRTFAKLMIGVGLY